LKLHDERSGEKILLQNNCCWWASSHGKSEARKLKALFFYWQNALSLSRLLFSFSAERENSFAVSFCAVSRALLWISLSSAAQRARRGGYMNFIFIQVRVLYCAPRIYFSNSKEQFNSGDGSDFSAATLFQTISKRTHVEFSSQSIHENIYVKSCQRNLND